jgi:hypothetical protein
MVSTEPDLIHDERDRRFRARITALEHALHALVDKGPVYDTGTGMIACTHCHRSSWRQLPVEHEPDCPVQKARALLKGRE